MRAHEGAPCGFVDVEPNDGQRLAGRPFRTQKDPWAQGTLKSAARKRWQIRRPGKERLLAEAEVGGGSLEREREGW